MFEICHGCRVLVGGHCCLWDGETSFHSGLMVVAVTASCQVFASTTRFERLPAFVEYRQRYSQRYTAATRLSHTVTWITLRWKASYVGLQQQL